MFGVALATVFVAVSYLGLVLTFALALRSVASGSRVEQVRLAEAAHAADGLAALREGGETAIPAAAVLTAILGAPGIFDRRPRRRAVSRQECDGGKDYQC